MKLRSFNARRRRFAMLAAGAVASMVPQCAFAAPTGDAALDNALAERFALIADDSVARDDTPEPFLRQAAALLDLARENNPKEVRFARSSASVLLRLGESERALAALAAVRALDPKDQFAQIQYVDLSSNRQESADAQEAYLQQVVDANGLSPEVRSHAAMSLMDLLYQRSEDSRALEMVDRALALNPQNVSALAEKYRLAAVSGDPLERARTLSALVQASPVDMSRLARVAHECIAAADYADAHSFYEFTFSAMVSRGQSPSIDDMIDLAGSELLGGSATDIAPLVKQGLTVLKDDGRLYAVDLLTAQYTGAKPEDLTQPIATARGVYLAQLAGVSQLLNKPDVKEMPTTNPAVPMPNVTADAAKLVAGDPAQLKTAYTVALVEQLWFDLYFRAAPVDDASIAALATLLGSDADPLVVRMQGWKLLSAGQAEEAKVKLAAVADRDGFAKLGLAAAQAATNNVDESKKTIGELLAARPTGMLAIYTATAAKRSDVKAEVSDVDKQVAQVFTALKHPVGDAMQNPRGSYLLTAQPVNISFGAGDPLLAKVTLQNNGRAPIAIGPGGYIEPRFVVDLSIRGDAARGFPAIATGQWAGAVRLLPGQSMTQTVRLDRGQAYAFFRQYPTPLMNVTAAIVTNAVPTSKGTYPAPGGQLATVGNVMERRSSPLFVEAYRAKVLDRIANGSPLERMNSIELACAVIPLLDQQADNKDAKSASNDLKAAVDAQLAKESVPEVKAWCTAARFAAGGTGMDMGPVVAMESPGAKAAALVLARAMPHDARQKLAQAVIDTGAQGPIAELAHGVFNQPDPPPPPATEPATPSNP